MEALVGHLQQEIRTLTVPQGRAAPNRLGTNVRDLNDTDATYVAGFVDPFTALDNGNGAGLRYRSATSKWTAEQVMASTVVEETAWGVAASWDTVTGDSDRFSSGAHSHGTPSNSTGLKVLACRITNSANQSIATATSTKVTFDTAVRDDGTLFNNANDRIVFPVTGWYVISFELHFQGLNAVGVREGVVKLNGGACVLHDDDYYASTGASVDVHLGQSTIYYFTAADYIELYAWQTSGSSLNSEAHENSGPILAAAYIGAGGYP